MLRAIRWSIFLLTAALISFQLFVPPIIGLSDQGDFPRVIGRFGYSRAEKDVPISEGYLSRKFVPDLHSRYPYLEQPTSEYVFVVAALGLNKIVSRDGSLDLTMIGIVHAAAFLAVFWYLLFVAHALACRVDTRVDACFVFIALFAALIFTDVGYVAYWNSFYSEPASAIFFLALFAESLGICARCGVRTADFSPGGASAPHAKAITPASLIRWSIFAALFTIAKPQNFAFAVLLVPLALRLGWLAQRKWLATAGAAAIAVCGFFVIETFPPSNIWATAYNQIFLVILPNSSNAAADLKEIGIDPKYADYSGTGAWTPRSAIQELVGNGIIGKRVTPANVGFFYLRHPLRMLRRARSFLSLAFSLRPEWCGNFELSAHRGHGAKATSFTLWSSFHEKILEKLRIPILIALLLAPLAAIALWFAIPSSRLPIEFAAALAIGALLAFGVAAYGDAWDNVKHCFLFNLELDACLLAGLCAIARYLPRQTKIALPIAALVLCSACHSDSPWYPVPEQEPAFSDLPWHPGRVVAMDDPDADRRIVRDIQASIGNSWRWTLQHPAIRLRIQSDHLKYTMDLAVPEPSFRDTGPVNITYLVNGHVLDQVRYASAGQRHFEKPVPPEWLKPGQENIVGADIDKMWTSPDGKPYGFIIARMGLAP